MNQTVTIGDIAEFEYSLTSSNCNEILQVYVNGDIQVAPTNNLINTLDSRE